MAAQVLLVLQVLLGFGCGCRERVDSSEPATPSARPSTEQEVVAVAPAAQSSARVDLADAAAVAEAVAEVETVNPLQSPTLRLRNVTERSVFETRLPIVIVDTSGQWIPDEPKVKAQLTILWDETDGRQSLADRDTALHFEGAMGIEIRGKTSQSFPKKQYGIELWDEAGQEADIPLLGMPAESDWVLHGPYSDKTLMRNHLAYHFSNRMGRYAVRTRFVEAFIKTDGDAMVPVGMDEYQGVYLWMEKIKRGEHRVPVQAQEPLADDSGAAPASAAAADLSGGYLLKIDKLDPIDRWFRTALGTRVAVVYPGSASLTESQESWIQDHLSDFERTLAAPGFHHPETGYRPYIDVASFIDHYLINELFRNIDGLRLSTYFHKDRGGQLVMGPVWDFNLSMGNAYYYHGSRTEGWMTDGLRRDSSYPVPFWWRRFLQDPAYVAALQARWRELREGVLSTEAFMKEVDDTAALLAEAQARNFQRWRILGRYVWPNPRPLPRSYDQEVRQLKAFMERRFAWMDGAIERMR